MSSRSSGSKGGKWDNILVFIDYNKNDETIEKRINESELLDCFKSETKEEKILKAKIWKHPIGWLPGYFGDWHEYTVVKSTNWFWSFEKQMNAIYVQRSRKIADVKNKLNGKDRSKRINSEGRQKDNVEYGETIYNIIEWIHNNGELSNSYNLTQSNCHYFASELYEAIVRDCGKRLDDTDKKSRRNEDDRLRILRPALRNIFN